MKILIVGNGKGSWSIRGQQLGAAIGARVTSSPSSRDWTWADVVVLVKKWGAQFARRAHEAKRPIIWDAVDFWDQPGENKANEARAQTLLQAQIKAIKPQLVIGATEAMAEAAGGIYLPHHSWAHLKPEPGREGVRIVAYEGNKLALDSWERHLKAECQKRGWGFSVNPVSLKDADIVVALRGGIWDGWICRQWKSGVKLVNAMAAGRPVITQMSAAWRELGPVGTLVETPADLGAAFDQWDAPAQRALALTQPSTSAFTLDAVAARYRVILEGVLACAA